jgi:hypothetical protein
VDALLIPTVFCPKAWEGMSGNEATRFCSYCHKHVHNLDALSAGERLALLSSPAAQVCARYKVAIRRPKAGRKASYARHLAKYGLGVAMTGSVLLVLWETSARSTRVPHPPSRYHAVAPSYTCEGWLPMPDDFYDEIEVATLGIVVPIPVPPKTTSTCSLPGQSGPPSVAVHLDPVQLQSLLESMPAPALPSIALPAPPKKKAGFFAGLHKT